MEKEASKKIMIRGDYSDTAREFLRLVGAREAGADLAHLAALAHEFARLPYENFTKVLRAAEFSDFEERIRTPEIVLKDHLELGAGGTCFSLTHFFRQVLSFSGFDIYPVLCDRSYGADTHCALVVRMGRDKFLVDPGYLMQEPLLIPESGESVQRGQLGAQRLVRLGASSQLMLISERDGARKIRYRLRDQPVSDEVFRGRWMDSFDWPMMRHLCVSRLTGEGQLYMRDGRMRLVREGEKNHVRLDAGFAAEVERSFGIDRRLVSMAHDAWKGLR
ncbi:MAG: arylamine N-acetyltransferase [bacterium]